MLVPVLFKGYCPECEADCNNESPVCPQCDTSLVKVVRDDDNTQALDNADHQFRQKAISILEAISEMLGKPKLFDSKGGDDKWYRFEDAIVDILAR